MVFNIGKKEEKLPIIMRIKLFLILCISIFIVLLVLYFYVDTKLSMDFESIETKVIVNNYYKDSFNDLISKTSTGTATGIPSIDNSTVVPTGNKVDITKGVGDFINLKQEYPTNFKSYSNINYRVDRWPLSMTLGQMYWSSKFYSNCTYYERSGVLKLFDKYVCVAMGTYWTEKFGLPENAGQLYRIYLDTGKTYDVISSDTKSISDSNTILDPTGSFSIGHKKGGNNVCITEFYLINKNLFYPIYGNGTSKPIINFENLLTFKDDPTHVECFSSGTFNDIPEFEGNVIAIENLKDTKVEELLEECREEVKAFSGN